MIAEYEGQCECGHCEEEHDCLSKHGECLNTKCSCRQYRAWTPRTATIATRAAIYTSTPLAGRPSAFHTSEGRYYANAEDARRAQKDLDELAALEAQLTAAGDRAADRLSRSVA